MDNYNHEERYKIYAAEIGCIQTQMMAKFFGLNTEIPSIREYFKTVEGAQDSLTAEEVKNHVLARLME